MRTAAGKEMLVGHWLDKPDETIFDVLDHCGLPLEKVWNKDINEKLVKKRKSPHWVTRGDLAYVRKKEAREEQQKSAQLYRYRAVSHGMPIIDGFMDEEMNARLEQPSPANWRIANASGSKNR